MSNLTEKARNLILGSIATAFLLLGGFPGNHMVTSQLDLGQQAWGEDGTSTAGDRDALVALYHAMGGEEWTHNDSWLSDAPLEDWYGLRVSNGRVIYLELDDNNLTGEIPQEIGMLDRLYVLDLRWNSITGGLDNLRNLVKLGELRLSANDFSGPIPISLGNMASLERLDLSDNRFTGSIPSEIGNLRDLEAFAAHGNQLTGKIPEELCRLQNLKRLVLSENALSGSISDILLNCTALQHVALADNQFVGSVPEEIISSKQMNWLDLRDNEFDDELQPVFRLNFPGIYIPNKLVDKLNGLAMWGRGSGVYTNEEFRLAVVRSLCAISVEEGLLELAVARVPAEFVDQARDSIDYINSYLRESGARINTLSDLERMMAKAEKRSLTKTLKRLDTMHNVMMKFEPNEKNSAPVQNGEDSSSRHHNNIAPAVFIVDAESSELIFGRSSLYDADEPINFLKVSDETEEAEFSTSSNSNIRFTVRLSTTGVYLEGETNLKADGEYEHLGGTTGGTEMNLYYAMHKVTAASGFTDDDTEVAHVEFKNHPAFEDKSVQVNWNLNTRGYFFTRFTATPSHGRFSPPFVMVQSRANFFER